MEMIWAQWQYIEILKETYTEHQKQKQKKTRRRRRKTAAPSITHPRKTMPSFST
jgi:hypothetical protein